MKLNEIQQKLKAPKNQRNNFGNYNYRSCEDILEAVKPLLGESMLTLSDEIVEIGGRVYVKATASFWNESEQFYTTAYARESLDKKGMDSAQITGSASSYARKYALNGLFLIDDNKDSDTDEYQKTEPVSQPARTTQSKQVQKATKEEQKETKVDFTKYFKDISACTSIQEVDEYVTDIKGLTDQQQKNLYKMASDKKAKLQELSFDNQIPLSEV